MVSTVHKAVLFLMAFSAGLPALAYADKSFSFICPFTHFILPVRQEIKTSQVSFRNVSDENATIERFTIRDFFGNVIFDGGASTATPLPENADLGVDVTNIPPGANYYLESDFFFNLGPAVPVNRLGFNMSATVVLSMKHRRAVVVSGLERTRAQEIPGGLEIATRSETMTNCVPLTGHRDNDDDDDGDDDDD